MGCFSFSQTVCEILAKCQEVMKGKEEYGILSSEYLVHWCTRASGGFTIQEQFLYFLSFLYFLKSASPIIVFSWSRKISYDLVPFGNRGGPSVQPSVVRAYLVRHLLQAWL